MNQDRQQQLIDAFRKRFSGAPSFIARAPGRVNLIGEHTDYNDGFVLPCALTFDVMMAVRPRADETVVLQSLEFEGDASFPLEKIEKSGPRWTQYIKGVAWAMQEDGHTLRGMDVVLHGNVPVGSGLSSSAALEVAAATAFMQTSHLEIDGPRVAQLCKRAENEFVGVNSGIMDQFISAMGQAGHALFLDCRDLSFQQVPFDPGARGCRLVVADTAKRRSLAESVYNVRVEECAEAVRLLSAFIPGLTSLRDIRFDEFQLHQLHLPDVIRRRARHVVTENARVEGAVDAMRFGALEGLGALMNASHDSLRDDYEVTGAELDAMVEESRRIPGTVGSRMTGAGFGGCTVSLVREDNLEHFLEEVPARYQERTGLEPAFYVVQSAAGAGILPV